MDNNPELLSEGEMHEQRRALPKKEQRTTFLGIRRVEDSESKTKFDAWPLNIKLLLMKSFEKSNRKENKKFQSRNKLLNTVHASQLTNNPN